MNAIFLEAGREKIMRGKTPPLRPKLAGSHPTQIITGLIMLFVWACSIPKIFGQQDVHAGLTPPAKRTSAPALELLTGDGAKMHLSDYRGKVVLLNFWATECGGCVLEIPSIVEIENAYKGKGFTAVGVSMDISYEDLKDPGQAWARVTPFVAKHGVNYPIAMGDDAVLKAYALNAFPATYLIDKSGRIAVSYVGLIIDKDNVATNVKSPLAEKLRADPAPLPFPER